MDIQLGGSDRLEGHFLARFLPRPLPANPASGGPFNWRRRRIIHPLVWGTHPIIDAYDKPTRALSNSTPREHVRRILSDDEWLVAGVFRIALEDMQGRERDQGNVTVLITTRPAAMSPSRAEAIVREIGRMLATIDLLSQTAIEIREVESSDGERCTSRIGLTQDLRSFFDDEYDTYPRIGASIGPAGLPRSGTLGFYVRFRAPTGDCKYFAITCHHVVSGGHDAVQPDGAGRADAARIAVNSPSSDDHEALIASLKDDIRGFETDPQLRIWEAKRELDLLPNMPGGTEPLKRWAKNRLAKDEGTVARNRTLLASVTAASTHLGMVLCSSGLGRTVGGSREGCILDWAAVEMDTDRLSDGTPDSWVNTISNSAVPKDAYKLYSECLHPDRRTSSELGDIRLSDEEFCVKMGRTTGITRGHINAVKPDRHTDYKLNDGRVLKIVSTETTVISAWGSNGIQGAHGFSAGGDSGSLVFDSQGNAVAMLWGGDRVDTKQGIMDRVHYVTPLKVLLSDIERSLQAALGEDWELGFI